jgi:hypothetical protein
MAITFSKLLALAITFGCFIAALVSNPGPIGEALLVLFILMFPLVLIWFPEIGTRWPPGKKSVLGYYQDRFDWQPARRDSPPQLVALLGWVFLLGLPALYFWLRSR